MKSPNPERRTTRLPGLVATTLVFAGCDAVNEAIDAVNDVGNDADVYYVLSLGTSLSVGVQPNGSGTLLPTDDGYPDQLFDLIRPDFEAGAPNRELRLTQLGCPGETLDDMVNGGSCPYLAGSQLDSALDFLGDNDAKVLLVTIDIGANDFRNADCITDTVDIDCVNMVSGQIATDLAAVLQALRGAADPATTIIGMNYYNPYLASWLDGPDGQVLATDSAQAGVVFNDSLATTYNTAGVPMADVYAAFESDDFATIVPTTLPAPNDMLPASVANVCTFTYLCDVAPVGPDVHANVAGYGLIAATLASLLP
ncbi:MAG: SGNH/GDSL hydrolase family protein [Gammaproteobacteria bacterium]|nr:SGNH/GDSL hydrolase family protein [Gammaproteobacteria bacterium]MDH5344348.1 SGNH/GDSL hydrolase family protein [Gammaproteobacteria bacterium]